MRITAELFLRIIYWFCRRVIFCQSTCFLLFFILLISCSSVPDAQREIAAIPSETIAVIHYPVNFRKGEVIKRVVCAELLKSSKDINAGTDSVTYALYLPSTYSKHKKYPVIFLFDPSGDGSLPIEIYKNLAEKYGYILAASNDSKNGMSLELNKEIIRIFMSDVEQRFSINPQRVYTGGFSGGSRVASSVAIVNRGIAGVMAMGAGFPSLNEPIKNSFNYIGFAGDKDFNMNEMIGLISSMDNSPLRHQLIIFNGKHEWAPLSIAEDAFVWFDISAMKDGIIPKNDTLINKFLDKNTQSLREEEKKNHPYEALACCKKVINYLDGFADVTSFKNEMEELNKSESLRKINAEKEKIAKEEIKLQSEYRKYFVIKDFNWWKNEIGKIKRGTKDKNKELASMNDRMLSYLSLVVYMNASAVLEADDLPHAESYLKLYELIDPPNPEHQYLFAVIYAKQKNDALTINALKKAITLGFKDANRVSNNPAFSLLKDSKEFQKLLSEIQQHR